MINYLLLLAALPPPRKENPLSSMDITYLRSFSVLTFYPVIFIWLSDVINCPPKIEALDKMKAGNNKVLLTFKHLLRDNIPRMTSA